MKSYLLTALIVLSLFAFSGCVSSGGINRSVDVNVVGLVKVQPKSFKRVGPLTIPLHIKDLNTRTAPDGDSVSILFGLITITDQ